jgi:GMP synthase-like glutamine amidotransferase
MEPDRTAGRAHVLQHDRAATAGLIGDWLRERGLERTDVLATEAERLPSPDGYDLVVSLGSEHSAADDEPWIAAEAELLRGAHAAGVPVLGVCFGGQLLARALGGSVRAGAVAEVGWQAVDSRDPDLIPAGPWFQWHFDSLTAPPSARVVADSRAGVEAFATGASLGLQFHPEVTREIVADWVQVYGHELTEHHIDGAALVAAAPPVRAAGRRTAQLLDRFFPRDGSLAPHDGPSV